MPSTERLPRPRRFHRLISIFSEFPETMNLVNETLRSFLSYFVHIMYCHGGINILVFITPRSPWRQYGYMRMGNQITHVKDITWSVFFFTILAIRVFIAIIFPTTRWNGSSNIKDLSCHNLWKNGVVFVSTSLTK